MPLQQLFTSRKPYDAETFVAGEGKLFFDESSGLLRLGDDVTPGGKIVGNLAIAAYGTTPPNNPYPGELWYNPTTKELWAYYNGQFRGTINQATTSTLGGVRLGPGVITNAEGQIIVDSSGLEFSFGDFSAIDNRLSTVNPNQDIYIESNGTGDINLIGGINFYKPNGFPPTAEPFFRATNDGQVRILVPVADINAGALEIIGNTTGTQVAPRLAGVMLHITGNDGEISRVYNDGSGNNAAYVGRRYNGTSAAPTQVLAGQSILRITAVGHDNTEMPLDGTASIFFDALQNFTTTARGSQIKFQTTAINSSTRTVVATLDHQDGVTCARFTGQLIGNVNATSITATNITVTGNVTGNVTATNITASSLVVGNTIRYDVTQNNGTATQLTSKSTTVVCNGRTGQIVTSNSSLAKGSAVTFTVTNSAVTSVTDVPVVVIQGGASIDSYSISVTRVQVGSFNITLTNTGVGPLAETLIINFAIVKVS